MTMTHPTRCKSALALAVVVGLAATNAKANDVTLSVSSKVPVGEVPTLTLHVKKAVKALEVSLSSPLGPVRHEVKNQSAGTDVVIALRAAKKPGQTAWRGKLKVTFADESFGTMPLQFSTAAVATMRVEVLEKGLDLTTHTLQVRLDRPAHRVEADIYAVDGSLIASVGRDTNDAPPGTTLPLTWIPNDPNARVMRIVVKGIDPEGFFSTTESYPYNVEVEHEEVVFDLGQASLRADEEPKLRDAEKRMKEEFLITTRGLKAAKSKKRIRLFVIGHTDTVGAPSANQALSERRAVAIARWFRRRGLKANVYARGMGEALLKVDTPDETAEEQNRRVDYVLAVESPTGSLSGWTPVR